MRAHRALLVVLALAPACTPTREAARGRPEIRVTFDELAVGPPGAAWKAESTKADSRVATWAIQSDDTAPSPPRVLALASPNHESESTFNLCWNKGLTFRNGTVEVSLRPLAGVADQGGGPAWRIRGADDYYICRYNPLEDNFRVYVVVGGVRKQLASAKAPARTRPWSRIRVEHDGDRIRCTLDGECLLEAIDATLPDAGGVGVWTKADARTAFDDLVVSSR